MSDREERDHVYLQALSAAVCEQRRPRTPPLQGEEVMIRQDCDCCGRSFPLALLIQTPTDYLLCRDCNEPREDEAENRRLEDESVRKYWLGSDDEMYGSKCTDRSCGRCGRCS